MNEIAEKQGYYKLALASAILGFFFISLPAIICGHMALSRINRNIDKYTSTDKRMAIAGLILGYSWMLGWLYLSFLIVAVILNWDISLIFPFGFGMK
jgi:hypothetical protein